MKKETKEKEVPANQSSSSKGANYSVRENDAKAAENQTKHTINKGGN